MSESLLLPWIEKHRPNTLEQIVGNTDTLERLKVIAHGGNMQNLILSGPPGIGKTSSVLCLARILIGEAYQHAVLELNASDERGIGVVRDQIRKFCQKKITLPSGRHKIVILDEADSMTDGAQQALRCVIEQYSETTRFAIACNDSSKIIEPLQSRCALVRFTRLSDEAVKKRLIRVAELEDVKYTEDALEALVTIASGDMRNALNNFEATWNYVSSGLGEGNKIVTTDIVMQICDQPNPEIIKEIVNNCLSGRLQAAIGSPDFDFNDTDMTMFENFITEKLPEKGLLELYRIGYGSEEILTALSKMIRRETKNVYDPFAVIMSEEFRLAFIGALSHVRLRQSSGVDSELQLEALLSQWCTIAITNKKENIFSSKK